MSKIEKKLKKLLRWRRKPKAFQKLMKRKRIYKKIERSVARRRAAETRFKLYGISAIALSFLFLACLLYNIFSNGYTAFIQTQIKLPITFSKQAMEEDNYAKLIKESLQVIFPEVTERRDVMKLKGIISTGADSTLRSLINNHPEYAETTREIWLPASSNVDILIKGRVAVDTAESMRNISDIEISWINHLKEEGAVKKALNTTFLKSGDSREPEQAGILGSLVGSIFVIISCMFVAFPLGVLTAIYLEEFAPKNRLTEFIEVNISNLAAVPSIVYGLLGLAVYLQMFGLPRSAPLAGGLTLALMALPVIVIATRTSIRAIPQSIRDGATALGASKVQTTVHHVLPLAMPGIMTGTILSIARVLGETAPLLMIGMVAFIVDVPKSFLQASSALPVQIYLWADSSEAGFVEKTSAAIIVLLLFLALANAAAVYLRKKFEVRW
jgi:phosphate transport system permease protein